MTDDDDGRDDPQQCCKRALTERGTTLAGDVVGNQGEDLLARDVPSRGSLHESEPPPCTLHGSAHVRRTIERELTPLRRYSKVSSTRYAIPSTITLPGSAPTEATCALTVHSVQRGPPCDPRSRRRGCGTTTHRGLRGSPRTRLNPSRRAGEADGRWPFGAFPLAGSRSRI